MSDLLVRVEAPLAHGPFSTIIRFTGVVLDEETLEETGETVVFGADHRPARSLVEAIEAGEEPIATVPGWAVIFTDRRGALQ